mgnify:CR=1 FL=1
MVPTQQSFKAHDLGVCHIDFRLVVENQLIVRDGFSQAQYVPLLFFKFLRSFDVEKLILIFSRKFGLIHGLIGLTKKRFVSNVLGLRIKADSYARGDAHDVSLI